MSVVNLQRMDFYTTRRQIFCRKLNTNNKSYAIYTVSKNFGSHLPPRKYFVLYSIFLQLKSMHKLSVHYSLLCLITEDSMMHITMSQKFGL